MVTLTIIANDAPYGCERTWNAMRLANTAASEAIGMHVKVFLMGDSVLAAKKGQSTPEGYYNLEKMIAEAAQKGVEIKTCGTCLKARGITDGELVEGVQRGTMMILANWVKESERLISF
jgi:uncharacterized protein involved in oxidation of intracellular sulfur